MCTVLAYFGTDLSREGFESYLSRTTERGPDDAKIVPLPCGGFFGFQRLAIMGLTDEGMQPFSLWGSLAICNGELYGFRKTKRELEEKGYSFRSDSDCELLLPLYREYGTEMFAKLDAEFACVIYDAERNKVIAARDPIGIRPLFYGYSESGALAFASEARSLMGLVKEVFPFPPGCWYEDGVFHRYRDPAAVDVVCPDKGEDLLRGIRERLIEGVDKRLDSDAPLGFLLSGGLDSSLVCAIAARKLNKPIRTFAVGMEKDAIDLKYARQVADYLGAEHTEFYMTPEMVKEALPEVISRLGTYDITTIRASMGMYLLCREIHRHTDVRVLLTGEVSDELFGYKYTDFAPSAQAFQEESQKRVRELYAYDVLRADRCIADNSIEARVPFGDLEFVRYVMSIDPETKRNHTGKGKYLLRKAFEGDWLPPEILWREKAAFSDAVGHSMVDDLKEYAEEMFPGDDWKKECAAYQPTSPFTKESLLYRKIFEKYYPGQGGMIPGFWMPNREWEGCDVDDPSARVLKNYGDSGK